MKIYIKRRNIFKKVRKSVFGLRTKTKRLKFKLQKHPKSVHFLKLIKKIKNKHPKLIEELFKVSHRKKKEVTLQVVV